MRIDAGQHLRMDQRMKLAPRMIQSMEILQMAQPALEERIEQELASNPTLELREAGNEREEVQAELDQAKRDDREGEREIVVREQDGKERDQNSDDFERLNNLSEEYSDSWSDGGTFESGEPWQYSRRAATSNSGERDAKIDAMANAAARGESLYEQLLNQWHLVETTPAVAAAGEYLLGHIDADGYLRTDADALRTQAPPDVDIAVLDDALELIQTTLEPAGIGARDLPECLKLQIDAKMRLEPDEDLETERLLVTQYASDIEANRLPKIARATGLSIDEINRAIHNLRQFSARPGKLLADDSPQTITPDAIVDFDEENDRYIAILTHGRIPSLTISEYYQQQARAAQTDKRTKDFINTNVRSARWLIDAIQQRNQTLLRVINVVVEAQRDFFDQGPQALKPLPMTLVADQLGIHVATVSRAVNEKYMQTPRGIYPLRMFFSGGTETESGESMSWAAVQAKLEEIIDGEDKSKPLSDDQLVEQLKKHGIEIARRTVAKYRKQLNIPPARQRKQY